MANVIDLPMRVRAVREIRLQASIVRVLLDQVDAVDPELGDMAGDQLVEELARLGCRILEAASALTRDE